MIIMFAILIVGIVGLAVYGIYLEKKNPTQQLEQNNQEDIDAIKQELNKSLQSDETQIANPASVYCEENGGKLEIRETESGQTGICVFDNGKECEEWAFYRKECDSNK